MCFGCLPESSSASQHDGYVHEPVHANADLIETFVAAVAAAGLVGDASLAAVFRRSSLCIEGVHLEIFQNSGSLTLGQLLLQDRSHFAKHAPAME